MRKALVTIMAVFAALVASAGPKDAVITHPDEGYDLICDISYVSADETDSYRKDRCRLDIYYPVTDKGFATLVWYHGGGLEKGSKKLLEGFRRQGFAVVMVNYRLYPQAGCPSYIDDAAQALAWTFRNIGSYGGDPDHIYVSGHSAGGYLALMLTLAKEYMGRYGIDAGRIAKSYPVSGQTVTHYTIRKERGLPKDIPFIDEYAPMYHAAGGGAPIVLITGDRDLEMLARWEENAHLYSLLKNFGHDVALYEMEGFNHNSVKVPAMAWVAADIRKLWRSANK